MNNTLIFDNEMSQPKKSNCSSTCDYFQSLKEEIENTFTTSTCDNISKTINCKVMDCTCRTKARDVSYTKHIMRQKIR